MDAIEIKRVVVSGAQAFVTYELLMNDGRRSRNTEFFTVQNGQITDVEVYFGWPIPHLAAAGKSVAANNLKEIQ